MGKKHYSGKELIHHRQMEKQRQQGRVNKNTIRKQIQDMNKLKKSVRAAQKNMRQRAREGYELNGSGRYAPITNAKGH